MLKANEHTEEHGSPASPRALPPVEKMRDVACDPATAFRVFTREIGRWWPFRGHSVAGERAATVVIEERTGGRVFERTRDGVEHDWGRVIVWDPPHRFAMTWHPGQATSAAQELEVVFTGIAGGRTRLHLVHRGWERLGEAAEDTRARYEPGWGVVLDCFAEALPGPDLHGVGFRSTAQNSVP